MRAPPTPKTSSGPARPTPGVIKARGLSATSRGMKTPPNLRSSQRLPTMGDVPGFAGFFQGDPTPTIREQRVLWVRAATFPRRLAAALVDLVIVAGVASLVTFIAAAALRVPIPAAHQLGPDLLLASLLDRNPMTLGALGLFLGLGGLYQIYLGGMVGQTLGKRWFGLRVISIRGVSSTPSRAIIRYLALLLSVLPAGLGWVWCLFDRERRAAHDHLAGTYVVLDD
jgi:uncharacterized RDD family membrane protein YckC